MLSCKDVRDVAIASVVCVALGSLLFSQREACQGFVGSWDRNTTLAWLSSNGVTVAQVHTGQPKHVTDMCNDRGGWPCGAALVHALTDDGPAALDYLTGLELKDTGSAACPAHGSSSSAQSGAHSRSKSANTRADSEPVRSREAASALLAVASNMSRCTFPPDVADRVDSLWVFRALHPFLFDIMLMLLLPRCPRTVLLAARAGWLASSVPWLNEHVQELVGGASWWQLLVTPYLLLYSVASPALHHQPWLMEVLLTTRVITGTLDEGMAAWNLWCRATRRVQADWNVCFMLAANLWGISIIWYGVTLLAGALFLVLPRVLWDTFFMFVYLFVFALVVNDALQYVSAAAAMVYSEGELGEFRCMRFLHFHEERERAQQQREREREERERAQRQRQRYDALRGLVSNLAVQLQAAHQQAQAAPRALPPQLLAAQQLFPRAAPLLLGAAPSSVPAPAAVGGYDTSIFVDGEQRLAQFTCAICMCVCAPLRPLTAR